MSRHQRTVRHSLFIEALSATPGPFETDTSLGLPPAALPSSKPQEGKGNPKRASFKVLALPCAMLAMEFLPKKGFSGPMALTVTKPDGTVPPALATLDNGMLSVAPITVADRGEYVFTVTGFANKKEKEKVVGRPQPAAAACGNRTVFLP